MKYSLNTEIGLIGIWDANSAASLIKGLADYDKYIVPDSGLDELEKLECAVFAHTGGDALFDVDLRIGEDSILSEDEKNSVETEVLGKRIKLTGEKLYIGSPENIGFAQEEDEIKNYIVAVKGLPQGEYSFDFFMIYKETTEPEMYYVFCLKKI